jgi:integrase/recombinase XerC
MGITPDDLRGVRSARPAAPTFAQYLPQVAAAVPDGSRRAYGSCWKRIVTQWGDRHLDDVLPSQIEQLRNTLQNSVVVRRNARGGRSAAEGLIAALRCLYQRAVTDGYLDPADNPAMKVDKPRRLPSTRQADEIRIRSSNSTCRPPSTTSSTHR